MRFQKWISRGTCAILGTALTCGAAWAQQAESQPLAALISELSGQASIRSTPAGPVTAAQRFDGLAPGATLELGPRSRGVIVLAAGQRFELGPRARATITARQLTSVSGPVTELPPLPALPRMVALDDSRPAGPPGGIRLRGEVISGLRPSHSVISTESVTLRFDAVTGATRYAVEVEDAAGRRIFAAESTKPELDLPPGVLEPGAVFYWTVQTLDKVGGDARGTGQFRTLSIEDLQLRRELRRSLQSDGEAAAAALVAEIDRRLGLYREALEGFRAALARNKDDVEIQRAIRWLENLERRAGQ